MSSSIPENVVVLQLGSLNLRLGFASDFKPHIVPHCIARRQKEVCKKFPPNDTSIYDEARTQEFNMLESRLKRSRPKKRKHLMNANFENSMRKGIDDDENAFFWTDVTAGPEFVVGEEAAFVHPADGYDIFYPIHRGRLNVFGGRSLHAVRVDLRDVWTAAIQEKLDISPVEFEEYSVIFTVPDSFDRRDTADMFDILLIDMGFRRAFVHQESVCSCFGSGVSSACVVDIGHTFTSVCCVEDGYCIPNTRFHLPYGSKDVEETFFWALKRDTQRPFPYEECTYDNPHDTYVIRGMKEALCTYKPDDPNQQVAPYEFYTTVRNGPCHTCSILVGDGPKFHAPMGYFHPKLFVKGTTVPTREENEDLYDDIAEGIQPIDRSKKKAEEGPGKSDARGGRSSPFGEVDHSAIMNPVGPGEGYPVELEKAVIASVLRVERDELMQKLFATILLVGAGTNTEDLVDAVEERVLNGIPDTVPVEKVDVVTKRPDFPAEIATWQGAAVMAQLENAEDMYITADEWSKFGIRVLRERSSFAWDKVSA